MRNPNRANGLLLAMAIALVGILGYSWLAEPTGVSATQISPPAQNGWEYGVLENTGGNRGYSFIVGDEILGQNGTSIDNLIRLVDRGYRGLPTEPNLWNALGRQGWELAWVQTDSSIGRWVFKRPL